MPRWSVLIGLLALVTAQAAPPADCSKSMLVHSSFVIYSSKAKFPDPSEVVTLDFFHEFNPAGAVTLCGFSFKPDRKAEVLTITAPRLANFSALFREGRQDTKRLVLENTYTDMSMGGPGSKSNAVLDLNTYTLTYRPPSYSSVPFTVGVKIDGGAIQPLYYDGKASTIKVPRNARTVDIYAKVDPEIITQWDRVSIDLGKAVIRFYREASFPTR
ncbi:hypothetical protein DAETH_11950 [Deinococcus aetherius]|uniref:Lipid/polyisoprenoid-binding YceI-like domain-containing protein n=2 Tax=Deinococcus aetherius TaxID=200252 RepID=A0ABM8ABT6_9DEIO|nr:hypothetical protein DAETH_11950 [Deinococcus aetherius]